MLRSVYLNAAIASGPYSKRELLDLKAMIEEKIVEIDAIKPGDIVRLKASNNRDRHYLVLGGDISEALLVRYPSFRGRLFVAPINPVSSFSSFIFAESSLELVE